MGPVNASDSKDPALPARVILYSRIKKKYVPFQSVYILSEKKILFSRAGRTVFCFHSQDTKTFFW